MRIPANVSLKTRPRRAKFLVTLLLQQAICDTMFPTPNQKPTATPDEDYMALALELAGQAEAAGEVPVGAVVVCDGKVIGRGFNAPISRNDPTAHAEILALREAAQCLGNYRLAGCTLYVTLEPCAMCAGALVVARIERLVFGTRDLRFGAVRSKFRIADSELLNHRVVIEEGLRGAECVVMLRRFFELRRPKT